MWSSPPEISVLRDGEYIREVTRLVWRSDCEATTAAEAVRGPRFAWVASGQAAFRRATPGPKARKNLDESMK